MNYGIDTIKHLAFVNALTESATPAEANRSTLILEVASRTALNLEEAEFAKTAKSHLVKNWKKYAAGAALAGAAGGAYALKGTGAKTAVVDAVKGAYNDTFGEKEKEGPKTPPQRRNSEEVRLARNDIKNMVVQNNGVTSPAIEKKKKELQDLIRYGHPEDVTESPVLTAPEDRF